MTLLDEIKKWVLEKIEERIKDVLKLIHGVRDTLTKFFLDLYDLYRSLRDSIVSYYDRAKSYALSLFNSITTEINRLWNSLYLAISAIRDIIDTEIKKVIESVKVLIKEKIDEVKAWISGLITEINRLLGDIRKYIESEIKRIDEILGRVVGILFMPERLIGLIISSLEKVW